MTTTLEQREKMRAYYKANKAKFQQYAQLNREAINEGRRDRHKRNSTKIMAGKRAWNKQWRENLTPEKLAEHRRQKAATMAAHRARKRADRIALHGEPRAWEARREHTTEERARRRDYAERRRWVVKFSKSLEHARTKGAPIGDREAIREFYRRVFSLDENTCDYCHGTFPIKQIVIDHKHPYALGGAHEVSNLCVSCDRCNLNKGIKPHEQWKAL